MNQGENNGQVSYQSLTTTPDLLNREAVRGLNDYILRNNFETEKGPRLEYSLDYKREFDKQGREWTANLQFQNVNEIEASDIDESIVVNSLNQGTTLRQRTQNDEGEKNLNFQTDYKTPLSASANFETGLRTTNRGIRNDYFVEEEAGEVWNTIEGLTNDFKYDEHVHAAYAIFNDKKSKYSYQLGLRYEYTDVTTTLINTNQVNPRQYQGLFPSGFFNYQITPENQIQLSYSRRIRRPGFRDLNPFFSFTDRINIRTGNPDLNPQYTNSYEVSFLKYFDNANFGATTYLRSTSDVITSIRELKEDQTTLNFPVNLGFEQNTGVELLGSYSGVKWWKIDVDLNLFHNKFYGAEEKGINNTESFAMNSRVNSRFTLAKNTEFQMRWNYAGPRNVPQGKSRAFTSLDLAFSKDITKDLTLTANYRDVFNQRKWRYERFTDDFYEDGSFQMSRSSGNITLSYRINATKERPKSANGQEGEQGGMMF
jgi:outer membrane receptor protein involved in Fe transport